MKKGISKRVLASIMVFALILTYCVPMSVFAETTVDTNAKVVEDGTNGVVKYYDANGNETTSNGEWVLSTKKEANYVGDYTFNVDLEVQAKPIVKQTTVTADSAVVLVFDASKSMLEKSNGETRLDKAKTAAKKFLTNYVKDAGNAERMVAVVQFGSDGKTVIDWTDANAGNGKVSTAVTRAIDDVKVNGATNLEAGMMLARNLLLSGLKKNGKIEGVENTNVILLTDGEPTYNVSGVNNSTSFIKGKKGGSSYDSYEDTKDIKPLADDIKATNGGKTALYTVTYETESTIEGWYYDWGWQQTYNPALSINSWLTDIVGVTKNISANNTAALYEAFNNLSQTITDSIAAESMTSEDTVGNNYVNLIQEETTGNPVVKRCDGSYTNVGNTLNWTLGDGTKTGDITTYKFSYQVKLDSTAGGFEEDTPYPIGVTKLAYISNGSSHIAEFTNVQVQGKIPMVGYTINFYKKSKTSDEYEVVAADQITGTAKYGDTITVEDKKAGYATMYPHYQFASELSTVSMALGIKDNELKVYYTPIEAAVTVNHYYKTAVRNEDNSTTEGEYLLGSNSGVVQGKHYDGDKFSATEATTYAFEGADITYKVDEYKVGEVTSKTNPEITLNKDGDNTVNIYYSTSVDKRAKATYTVYRQYETGKYELNADGRYAKVYEAGAATEYEATSGDVRAFDTLTTSTTENVTSGYKYVATRDNTNAVNYDAVRGVVTMGLVAGPNTLTTVFRAEPAQQLVPAKIVIEHNYTRNETYIDENGDIKSKSESFTDTDNLEGYYVGEFFTPAQKNTYKGETYNSDSANAALVAKTEIKVVDNKITFNYTLTVLPKEATVTVQHHYIDHKLVTLEDGTNDYKDVEDDSKLEVRNYPGADDKLYVAQKFVPTLVDKAGYTFASADGTVGAEGTAQAAKILVDDNNIINIYYISNEIDARDETRVSVKFTYITHLETVIKGRVTTSDSSVTLEEQETITGKVGDDVKAELEALAGKYSKHDNINWTQKTELPNAYVLKKTNDGVEIVYERNDSDLKTAVLKVVYKLVDKIMFVNDNNEIEYREVANSETIPNDNVFAKNPLDSANTINLGGKLYAGEFYSLIIPDTFKGYTKAADGNSETDVTLKENTELTYVYEKTTDLPQTAITVNRHLEYIHISEVGEKDITNNVETEIGKVRAGQTFETASHYEGYSFKYVVDGKWYKTENATSFKFDQTKDRLYVGTSTAAVTVDLYYTKTVDKSEPTEATVRHHFFDVDYDKTTTENANLYQVTTMGGFATQTKTATILEGTGYTYDASKTTPSETITLVKDAAANVIDLYYYKDFDSRDSKLKTVTVNHYYYTHDESGLVTKVAISYNGVPMDVVEDGTAQQTITDKSEGAYAGGTPSIKLANTYNGKTYDVAKSYAVDGNGNPVAINSGIVNMTVSATDDNQNIINIYYLNTYNASANVKVAVNHIYTTRDTYTGNITTEGAIVNAAFGDTNGTWNVNHSFTAAEMLKAGFTRTTSDENMTIFYHTGDNAMTVEYEKTWSSKPSGGGGGGRPPVTPTPTDIPDGDVPLGDGDTIINDGDVPLGNTPEEELIDEEVPLANLPKTGGLGVGLFLLVGGALTAAGVGLRRKEDEEK